MRASTRGWDGARGTGVGAGLLFGGSQRQPGVPVGLGLGHSASSSVTPCRADGLVVCAHSRWACVPAAGRWREFAARWTVFVVATTVACLGFAGEAGYVVLRFVDSHSCHAMGERLAPGLAKLSELQWHPPDATPQGTPTWDCDQDQDEESWYVAQRFKSADVHPVAGVAYYRKALRAAGWSAVTGLPPGEGYPEDNRLFKGPDPIDCFTRAGEGAKIYLLVQNPELSQRGAGVYELQASRARNASGGCGFV